MKLFNLLDDKGDVIANGLFHQCDSVLCSYAADGVDVASWAIVPA